MEFSEGTNPEYLLGDTPEIKEDKSLEAVLIRTGERLIQTHPNISDAPLYGDGLLTFRTLLDRIRDRSDEGEVIVRKLDNLSKRVANEGRRAAVEVFPGEDENLDAHEFSK